MRVDDCDKYCVFHLADSWFGLPATCLLEVSANLHVRSVPYVNPVLAGVCHHRNEFIAVLDLHALAGEGSGERSDSHLIVLSGSHGPWAVSVDRVIKLASLDVSVSQDVHQTDDWMSVMLGSATVDSRVVRILDPGRLYRYADNLLLLSHRDGVSAHGIRPARTAVSDSLEVGL